VPWHHEGDLPALTAVVSLVTIRLLNLQNAKVWIAVAYSSHLQTTALILLLCGMLRQMTL
jgi:hypothetical protein